MAFVTGNKPGFKLGAYRSTRRCGWYSRLSTRDMMRIEHVTYNYSELTEQALHVYNEGVEIVSLTNVKFGLCYADVYNIV